MAKPKIEVSNENTAYWASRPYLSEAMRAKLPAADVLLVPQEGFRGEDVRIFPVGTEEFYGFLKENLDAAHPLEIAIEDTDYRELALHSALIVIGTLVVKYVVVPTVVKVVADYLSQRLKGAAKKETAMVRFEMIVQEETAEGGKAMKISYDGPAVEFLPVMQEAIKETPTAVLASSPNTVAPSQLPSPVAGKSDAKS